jgi:hypothetical protein
MQQPAIQAALDNLVEVIRTALTAEFLEYFRGGDAEPLQGKRQARRKSKPASAPAKATKKASRKAAKRASL